jgi:hypothetical protein
LKAAEWVPTGAKQADGAAPLTTDQLVKGGVKRTVEVCKKSHFNSIFKTNILDFGGFGNKI